MDDSHTDVENAKAEVMNDESSRREFKEAALLLSMWSILVMNEGVLRFIQDGQPAAGNLFGGTPVRFWGPFLGGLFEVIFGAYGLMVGLAASMLGYFSRKLMYSLIAVQTVLGWYVFIDYVFVIPAFRIASAPPMLGLPVGASNAIGILGILTSLGWCLALQGGQFVFICRMMAYSGQHDFLKQRTGARMRAIFWNMNYMLAGLWAIITAGIVIANRGPGITSPGPFFAPPNVGRIPVYLLVTGLLVVAWALLGIAISVTNNAGAVRKYAVGSFFVFLFVHVHYTIGQLGYIAGNPAEPEIPAVGGGTHNHLALMVAFLGPYFMLKHAEEMGH